jgi:hypothetical protein
MSQEFMYLEQIFGRGNGVWLSVSLLIGLLVAVIFRPNTIHNPMLFRAACWLLALAVVSPPAVTLLISLYSAGMPGRGMGMGFPGSEVPFLMACANFLGPLLQGSSIICGLTALLPPITSRPPMTGPARHPME